MTEMTTADLKNDLPFFKWAVPESLDVPKDQLQLVLLFYGDAVVMESFEGDLRATKLVSAMDIAHALAQELSFSSGLLPKDTLWWANTPDGPVVAIWKEPQIWQVALQEQALESPRRFRVPMPGLVFLCRPGQAPWIYAAKRRPTKESDIVYRAPLCNLFNDGRNCPGSHKFPMNVGDIPDSFFRSFFSPTADLQNRSEKFPDNVVKLWEYLDGKNPPYPLKDLVKHGTVKDLMQMDLKR